MRIDPVGTVLKDQSAKMAHLKTKNKWAILAPIYISDSEMSFNANVLFVGTRGTKNNTKN